MDWDFFTKIRTYSISASQIFECLKIILSVFLVLGDIITDLVYAFKVEFYSEELRGWCILFIIILPFLVYVGFLLYMLCKVRNLKKEIKEYFSLILLSIYWFFFGSIVSIMYPVLEKFEKFAPKDYRLFFQLSAIEILIESLPQLIIQGINNTLLNRWTALTIISFGISGISLLRGSYILSTIMYRRQYEDYINQIESQVIDDIIKKFELNENSINIIEQIKMEFYKKFYPYRIFLYESSTYINSQSLDFDEIIKYINKSYEERFSHNIDKTLICNKLAHPPKTLLMIEFFMIFSIWLLNLVYLLSAEFYDQTLRFILFLFLSFGYIISTAGKFENDESISFKNFLLARICIVSHFDMFIHLIFDKTVQTVKTSYNLIFETLTILLCCVPVIFIIAINNYALNRSNKIYWTVFAFNIIWLAIIALRILQILITEILFKKYLGSKSIKKDQAKEEKTIGVSCNVPINESTREKEFLAK